MNGYKSIVLCVTLGILLISEVKSQHILRSSTLSNGSDKVASTSYILNPSLGQPISGTVSSASYILTAGFLPTAIPREAELTLQSTLSISPLEVPPGGTTSISFTLFNSGAVDVSADISAEVYLSANIDLEAGDILLDNFGIVTNMAAGATLNFPQGSETKSVEIPAGTTVGDYYIMVDLKTSTPIAEINSNNTFFKLLKVSNTTTVDITAPSVTSITPTSTFSSSEEIIATITDASEIESAFLFHRPITGSDFVSSSLTKNGSNFFVQPEDSWAGELGMEGYIIARDVFGNTIQENSNTHFFLYRELDPVTSIPLIGSNFNGRAESYRMFSIPYELADKSLVSIFDELGGYDQDKWRIFHYSNGQYIELLDGLNNITLGDGYWFNTTVPDFSIEVGAGTVAEDVTPNNPFTRSFVQGWNQIGNPYPFAINWSDIQSTNPDQGLGSLQLYQNGSYQTSSTLNSWEGAFVFCETAGSVNFPLSANTSGRMVGSTTEDFEWKIDLSLELNGLTQASAVGMHQQASQSKDRMDEIAVPRFISYLEMTTQHPEYFAPKFSSDIVPPSDTNEWTFTLESNRNEGLAILQWDMTSLNDVAGKAFLMDLATLEVLDMSQAAEYHFNWKNGKQFSIYYSKDGVFVPSHNHIGEAYPNPFNESIQIPLLVNSEEQLLVVTVVDAMGREVTQLRKSFDGGGLYTFEWDGKDVNGLEINDGVYFYQVDLNGKKKVIRVIKK
ncbi:MAG: T9SS type A sorting domain-containing protein [Cyclobacteriaceae bacterium]